MAYCQQITTSETMDRLKLQSASVSVDIGEEPENDIMSSHGVVLNQNLDQESMLLSLAPLETISTEDAINFPKGAHRGPFAADFLYPLPSGSAYIFDFDGREIR
jgi:hypothetical protein